MQVAEAEHWRRVNAEQWSGPPTALIRDGFRCLGLQVHEHEILAAFDGYACAVEGWAVDPDARETLLRLREQGSRLGLRSNTWWAAAWHAALVAHGLADLLDAVVYTSNLPTPCPTRRSSARLPRVSASTRPPV